MGTLEALVGWLDATGAPLAPLLVIVFVVSTLLCVPASGMALVLGAFLGLVPGSVVATTGTVLSAALARFVVRSTLGRRIRRWIDGHQRLRVFHRALQDGGWKLVFLTRLSPALPLGPGHWVFAFVELPLLRYLLVTMLATLPAQLMWINLGRNGRRGLELFRHPESADLAEWAILGLSVVATLGSVVFLSVLTRRRLQLELARAQPRTSSDADAQSH